ncbi:hypothetical protein [Variovorax sp. Root411]|uniref:hypothetical protein n=1 Tax=Variovorax sp. Root411 TaxID=1736530 RepID=UPI0006F4D8F1|nr:hypothetical protein [Variovorax sp. Root411]KQW62187.1 hypothetical protein ASC92_25085 [Variovorax sp. Root411]
MNKKKLKIVTLLVRHGTSKYPNALEDIEALFARQLPDVVHDCVIVDNTLSPGHEETLQPGVTLIGGSNSAWEFSAWDSGVAYLGSRLHAYDFVHLATSAFKQLYIAYLERFDGRMLDLLAGRGVAIGHIDYYNEPVELLGVGCQSWLRTSFVFLSPTEVKLLGSFVSVTSGVDFFSGDPQSPFQENAPISSEYRRNILGWLTGDGTEQGVEWHSRFKLDIDTLPFFESKTLAIFNEQMLSNRLRAQGCRLVDATWAATRTGRMNKGDEEFFGAIPHWQVQVTSRDRDAGPDSLLV